MGMFDYFIPADESSELSVQLKVGPCLLDCYKEGDPCPEVADGIYHAPEGVVVIHEGKVLSVTEELPPAVPAELNHYTKWGGGFDPDTDNIEDLNPLANFVKAWREENK